MRGIRNTPEDVWRFVDKNGPIPSIRPDLGPCWMWIGALNSHGYGTFRFHCRTVPATRFIVGLVAGEPIAKGMEPDHLCRNRACVNPNHIEVVTRKENGLRGNSPCAIFSRSTHCVHGHPFSGDNLMLRKNRGRDCRECHRKQVREAATRWRARQKA